MLKTIEKIIQEIQMVTKEIGKLTGQNKAYKFLKPYIEASRKNEIEIMIMACALGEPAVKVCPHWNSLRKQFFEKNQDIIFRWCEYVDYVKKEQKFALGQREFVIEVFSGMKKRELFGTSSYKDVAGIMLRLFEMPHMTEETLCVKLKESDGYLFTKIFDDYTNHSFEKNN